MGDLTVVIPTLTRDIQRIRHPRALCMLKQSEVEAYTHTHATASDILVAVLVVSAQH